MENDGMYTYIQEYRVELNRPLKTINGTKKVSVIVGWITHLKSSLACLRVNAWLNYEGKFVTGQHPLKHTSTTIFKSSFR